jgi:hypothetical protein
MTGRGPFAAPAILLTFALALMGCPRSPRALSDEEAYQRFVGIWVNNNYPGTLHQSQLTVIRPDFVGEDRLFPDSSTAEGEWRIKVEKTWVDPKGNTLCRFQIRYYKGSNFVGTALMQVDRRGKVLQINSREACEHSTVDFLERIDPLMNNYWVYYRK